MWTQGNLLPEKVKNLVFFKEQASKVFDGPAKGASHLKYGAYLASLDT